MASCTRRARRPVRTAEYITADVFSGPSSNWRTLRLFPFQGGLGEYGEVGQAGMLIDTAATSGRLPGQYLESLARERMMNRTVDGDVLPDATRSQMYRLPPVT